MARIQVDHVTIAGRRLDDLRTWFAEARLATTYGGRHQSNVTEMALRVFEDGSYLELISTVEPGPRESVWRRHIEQDGGPAAWSLAGGDLNEVASRAAALGIPVTPPVRQHRQRPDGQVAEWELLRLGDGEPGAIYPFFIRDLTPRESRVPRALLNAGPSSLTGVALVVLGVAAPEPAGSRLEGLLRLPNARMEHDTTLDAEVTVYPGTGVALAAPTGDGWLAQRITRVGESPCVFLFAVRDLVAASQSFDVLPTTKWLGRNVAWLNPATLRGMRVGLTQSSA